MLPGRPLTDKHRPLKKFRPQYCARGQRCRIKNSSKVRGKALGGKNAFRDVWFVHTNVLLRFMAVFYAHNETSCRGWICGAPHCRCGAAHARKKSSCSKVSVCVRELSQIRLVTWYKTLRHHWRIQQEIFSFSFQNWLAKTGFLHHFKSHI